MVVVINTYFYVSCSAYAQSFAARFANANSLDLDTVSPINYLLDNNFGEVIKAGLIYGLEINSVYNTNFFLSADHPERELSTNFSPWISYVTDPEGEANISVTANYHPVIQTYLENSGLDSIDQSGDITMHIEGSRTIILSYLSYGESSGTDPIIGEFVNESLFTAGIQGIYQIGSRTAISTSLSIVKSNYSNNSIVGSNVYTTYVGGYWSVTEQLSIGPAINYILTESNNTGEHETCDFSVQTQYMLGERIQMVGSIGIQYKKNPSDTGANALGITGHFKANYLINEMLKWVSSVQYITVPSPTELDYNINNLMISTALDYIFYRARFGLGIDLNIASYEKVGVTNINLSDKNNFGTFIYYKRNFFVERVNFESKLRYSVNDGQSNWSQLLISAGFKVQF